MPFEENEVSQNANGGTELAKRRLGDLIDQELLSNFQIVCSRPRELDMSKIRLFWCHDLPEDPESKKIQTQEFRDSFHKFVFISDWQYTRYQLIHGVPYDQKSIVLESGIDPAPNDVFTMKDDKTIRLAYTSTPQRGLDILLPVFEKLAETDPNIHLDVFSSFKIYGWDDYDKQFEPLYDRVRKHPQMTYHGFVPNADLKAHLNTCHILAYPNIWLETSCRAMLEAMSAGMICVHPNYGALPETSGGLNIMYQGDSQNKTIHADVFYRHLTSAVDFVRSGNHLPMINFNKAFVDSRYNIDKIKTQWTMMLTDLVNQYPPEKRGKPEQRFVYRTH